MKNFNVLISEDFFLDLTSLEKAKQGINCNISLSLIINDLEVVMRELLGRTDFLKAQILDVYK